MEQIVITHGFVKKLAKNIRSKYGRDARHTEVLELVADALGYKAGPLMHALKRAEAERPRDGAVSCERPMELPLGLVLRRTESDFDLNALPSDNLSILRNFIDGQRAGKRIRAAGLEPPNKILLFGSMKGEVAGAIAGSLGVPLFEISCGDLLSQGPGGALERLRAAFDFAATPQCALFVDDLDVVGMDREAFRPTDEVMKRIASTLLVHLDDVPSNVILIGGTNHPALLDRPLLRRFHVRINLPASKPGISRVPHLWPERLLLECEALTEFQRRHIALVEKEETGEHVLLVVENYDKHPDVSAARSYLQRKGFSWSRVEFCSVEDLAAVYESAARSRGDQ